jgi:hypothetical protein
LSRASALLFCFGAGPAVCSFGDREFESLKARHFGIRYCHQTPPFLGLKASGYMRSRTASRTGFRIDAHGGILPKIMIAIRARELRS